MTRNPDIIEVEEAAAITLDEVVADFRSRPAKRCPPGCSKHCVYLIQDVDSKRIKIGWTRGDPKRRLRELQTGSSGRLALLAAFHAEQSEERWMHGHFKADRLHGEWFTPSEHLLGFVRMRIAANEGNGT